MDDRFYTDNSVGAGAGEQLHDGWIHPYFDCDRYCNGLDQSNSGPENLVTSRSLAIALTKERRNKMKTNTILGIILIIVGVIAFAYQGISYTTREKVVDLGPIQVSADKEKTIPLPPIVGAVALVGGIVLLVMGNKKS